MKIEFNKISRLEQNLVLKQGLIKVDGTFCRVSNNLLKVQVHIDGNIKIICSRCNEEYKELINEEVDLLISNGIYKDDNSKDAVIECINGIIDFDELIKDEISSIQSDYHMCTKCTDINSIYEKEF